MKIIIDGEIRPWSYSEETTLEEAIIEINDRLVAEEMIAICDVKVDDFSPSIDPEATWDKVAIADVFQVSLQTEPLTKIISRRTVDACKMADDIKQCVSAITNDLSSDKIDSGMDALKSSIDKLIWIFDLIKQAEAIGVRDLSSISMGDETFGSFMDRFNGTLTEIFQAMTNKDITLINDFLEYEFEPAITEIGNLLKTIKTRVDSLGSQGAEL